MNEELSKEIFRILLQCREQGVIIRDKGISVITRQAINESDALNWIYAINSYSYKLTKEGISVLDSGTVENYINSSNKEKGEQKSFIKTFSIIIGILAALVAICKFIIENLIK